MTTTMPQPPAPTTVPAIAPLRARRRRSWRWLRAAIPFAVLIVLWLGITVTHAIEEPNLDEPGTLSPTGTGVHGSSRLAQLLRSRGVVVDRVTSSRQALGATNATESTVFVPTPDYLTPSFFADIVQRPGVRRVVVLRPGLTSIIMGGLPVFPNPGRWVTKTVPPGCNALAAVGPAAALDTTYDVPFDDQSIRQSMYCYHGSVVGVDSGGRETVYVGANDPFRNNRIDEVGNAALAVALLGGNERVIWVDVHAAEPRPTPDVDIGLPRYRRADRDRTDTGFPLIDAFPSWLWAGLLLAFVAAILLAVARARRLGPPVSEPLAVIVPAAEVVTGRGRLYERISAREATFDALRGAALGRMAQVLNKFGAGTGPAAFGTAAFERDIASGGPGADQLVRQIAQRTGSPEAAIRAVIFPARPPADDGELAQAIANVDAVTAAVLGGNHAASQPPFQGGNP